MRFAARIALLMSLAVSVCAQATRPRGTYLDAPERRAIQRLQAEISADEMRKTLEPFDKLDRISGGSGEARAAGILVEALKRYGVEHTVHRFRAYLSWPVRAELRVESPARRVIRAVTPSFSASTAPEGMEGELVFVGSPGAIFGAMTETPAQSRDVRGKVVVADGLITPQHARSVEDRGGLGVIHINPRELLHEMIMTTVWGTPTPESAARIPKIPGISISQEDGAWLKELAKRGPVRVRVVAEVSTKWREIPLVEARVNATGPLAQEFILISSHLDAWYAGMTDTASTDASILEMARILKLHRKELRRSFRFVWWTGHSTGRYAGSTWYADNFWMDLDRYCIAYMNLDGPGARNVPLDEVATWGWPEIADFTRDFARELTGKEPKDGYFAPAAGIFRPFRAGDSAFQGIGIPEVSIGLPEIPSGHPDHAPYVGGSERGWWWHTKDDSIDKIDMRALVRDTELRLAELYMLGTVPIVPYRMAAIGESYVRGLEALHKAVGSHLDLSGAWIAADDFRKFAYGLETIETMPLVKLRKLRRPLDLELVGMLNREVLKMLHELNAALYTSAGRFQQDPAAPLPILPGLDAARELARLDPASNDYGFLFTDAVRERNRVMHALREAMDSLGRVSELAERIARKTTATATPEPGQSKQ